MGVALEFECGAPTDDHGVVKYRLKGYHRLLPAELAARTAIDAARWLFQPACGNIMILKRSRVTAPG